MTTDRPESVRVIGQPFSIAWSDADVLSDRSRLGHSDITGQAITVRAKQGAEQARDTLLHELLHTCFNMTGTLPDEKQQETIVALLAPVLLDVLRDNPDVTRWLVAE